jgi:multicomponent Na+:H+ antiporter subunit B
MSREPRPELREKEPVHRPWTGLLLTAAVGLLLGVAALGLPREDVGLPDVARQALAVALPQWHTTEPVNEIVYGTRAFDTFGETFLLLAAVVSVMMLTRHREPRQGYFGEEEAGREEQRRDDPATPAGAEQQAARAAEEREETGDLLLPDDEPVGTPAPERAQAMTLPVRLAVRIVLPVLSVAGFYLVLLGYAPGGGFPAGVVAVGVILLVYAAFGHRRIDRVVRPGPLEVLELLGALAIIMTLGLGLPLAGSFGANWLPLAPEQTIRSGGTVQAFSVAEFFEVGTGVTIVVFAVMAMLHDWTPDEGRSGDADNGRRR